MQHLYVFGYIWNKHRPFDSLPQQQPVPARIFCAKELKILWASQCDLIFAALIPGTTQWNVYHHGSGPMAMQKHVVTQTAYHPDRPPVFFGRQDDGHGVRGIILPLEKDRRTDGTSRVIDLSHRLIIFHTELEIERKKKAGYALMPIEDFNLSCEGWDLLDITCTSREGVFISTKIRENVTLARGEVYDVPSLEHLADCLRSRRHDPNNGIQLPLYNCERANFAPSQWEANATTFTALNQDGKVYTYASDRRYPKCIGRPLETYHNIAPHKNDYARKIPYFSELQTQKIASGGYYSAAVSDGELFIWGQAPPGSGSGKLELKCLAREPEPDEDEIVRPAVIEVDGQSQSVTDVAIGWGHILVASEHRPTDSLTSRCVHAAGQNDRGQLGIEPRLNFVEVFTRVKDFDGMKIKQMVCAGRTSYVVVEDEKTPQQGA